MSNFSNNTHLRIRKLFASCCHVEHTYLINIADNGRSQRCLGNAMAVRTPFRTLCCTASGSVATLACWFNMPYFNITTSPTLETRIFTNRSTESPHRALPIASANACCRQELHSGKRYNYAPTFFWMSLERQSCRLLCWVGRVLSAHSNPLDPPSCPLANANRPSTIPKGSVIDET